MDGRGRYPRAVQVRQPLAPLWHYDQFSNEILAHEIGLGPVKLGQGIDPANKRANFVLFDVFDQSPEIMAAALA